jgi:uncharacterized membrane protein YjgN (DUF898 family)
VSVPAPPPPLPARRPAGLTRERYGFEFTGSAGEYFRVWIVNVALSVVTLGIYSAWAKVRNKQYFYGNARLAGGSFEYTAHPLNILKGRLLVGGAVVAYLAAEAFQPVLALAMLLALVPLVPWVVTRAIAFNLRYSAYRGLRFHFDGGYGEAFRVYVLWTLALILTLGLLYPSMQWRRKKFLVDNARYGRSPFHFDGEVGWFYIVYVVGSLVFSGVLVAAMVVVFVGGVGAVMLAAGTGTEGTDVGEQGGILFGTAMLLVYAGMALVAVVIHTAMQAMIANYVWEHTRTADVTFELRLEVLPVVWIQATNIVAIAASLGLLIPWARVRMARYRLSRFSLLAVPADLDRFFAAEREAVSATGAELGEALDLDLGF